MQIARLLILISIAIFGSELAIMFVLDYFQIGHGVVEAFVDALALVVVVFPVLYFFTFRTTVIAKERLEERIIERTRELETANRALEQSVRTLSLHQREMVLLGEMGNLFQACQDLDEGMVVAEVELARLFPQFSGGLFLMNASHNILDRAVTLGTPSNMGDHHAPEDCWALRRSKPHVVNGTDRILTCRHGRSREADWQICLPLIAQGEVLGTLCLESNSTSLGEAGIDGKFGSDWMQFCVAAAEVLALAIANLRLRETLQYQALRDPLTGLFNRRYLLDVLERELDHAVTSVQPCSVLMFDIDHFKRFNDVFGHLAGDTVLTRLGTFVREWAQDGDIPVRCGGEEFTIVLPDTPVDQALARAESLRAGVASLAIEHNHQSLGQMTISLGVASYPEHGDCREALIQSADKALYISKQGGRNRTTVATADEAGPAGFERVPGLRVGTG